MWTPQKTIDGSQNGYALGWGWGSGKGVGVKDVGHSGGQQGTSTFIMLVPDMQMGVVILVNRDDVDSGALATQVMEVLVGSSTSN